MAAMSNYLENKLIDWMLRGQAYTPPTSTWVALYTVAPTDAGGGTEVSGNNYARLQILSNMTNWSGTQASATTVASTGNTGTTSNNGTLNFNVPSGAWGVVTHFGLMDQSSGGNLLFFGPLTVAKNIGSGDTVVVDPDTIAVQIDD
jgi:hypothetical protein